MLERREILSKVVMSLARISANDCVSLANFIASRIQTLQCPAQGLEC